jgi:hypothetical protein
LGAERWRQDGSRLILVFHLGDNPGFVLAVHAPPVGVGQKVGTGIQKDLGGVGASHSFMGNLNEISSHNVQPPSADFILVF